MQWVYCILDMLSAVSPLVLANVKGLTQLSRGFITFLILTPSQKGMITIGKLLYL
jgi:hypothetical protein